jgi:hypothetical protein
MREAKMGDTSIVVAYIARREEGISSIARFVGSYRLHPAGSDHRLVILQKGFTGEHARAWRLWQELLGEIPHVVNPVPDDGFDLGAYRSYLPTASGRTVLFLNSHSEILVDQWLDLMARHVRPGCLIGATGSWESHRSNELEPFEPPSTGLVQRLRCGIAAFRVASRPEVQEHPAFPNPAVRTNAFLVPPDLHHFLLKWPVPRTKEECHALESGKHGLTAAVVAAGGTVQLAGADGIAHSPLSWPAAGLFRSAGQHNLLIADNQTRQYDIAPASKKRVLGWFAWRSFYVPVQP